VVLSRAGMRVHAARKAAQGKALCAVVFVAGLKPCPSTGDAPSLRGFSNFRFRDPALCFAACRLITIAPPALFWRLEARGWSLDTASPSNEKRHAREDEADGRQVAKHICRARCIVPLRGEENPRRGYMLREKRRTLRNRPGQEGRRFAPSFLWQGSLRLRSGRGRPALPPTCGSVPQIHRREIEC